MDRITNPRALRRRFEPSLAIVEEMMEGMPYVALSDAGPEAAPRVP